MSGKSIREALAAVGIVLSLVFVGLELRQNTLAVRATALNDLDVTPEVAPPIP
jgi:hypothetical protein